MKFDSIFYICLLLKILNKKINFLCLLLLTSTTLNQRLVKVCKITHKNMVKSGKNDLKNIEKSGKINIERSIIQYVKICYRKTYRMEE